VLANLPELGVRCEEVSASCDQQGLTLLGTLIYGATLGVWTPCGLAFKDERVEGRAIVRVHILDPAALATSSQALCVFLGRMATLGRERYNCACELISARCGGPPRGRGFDSRRSHFALVQSNTHLRGLDAKRCRPVATGKASRYWGPLIYGATLGVWTPCGLASRGRNAQRGGQL